MATYIRGEGSSKVKTCLTVVIHGAQVSLCVCVCPFVITLAISPFIYGPKTRYHRLRYDDFLDFDSRISLKRLRSRDMALYAYVYHGEP